MCYNLTLETRKLKKSNFSYNFFRINMYNYINKENFKSYFLNVFQIHMCQFNGHLLLCNRCYLIEINKIFI